MTDLIGHLAGFGRRPALIDDGTSVSYRELADLVGDAVDRLGRRRRLVSVPMRHEISTVAGYLGALAGRHVVLAMPHDRSGDAIIDTYQPDAVIESGGAVTECRDPGGHELHDDLALLMSTSGSTGSPKLVRLSRGNLISNAESIATYLEISERDRAATVLPMSYCYGLSVVHTHLLRGASLLLTGRSVMDASLWELFAAEGCTSFAGVPYTFDMLDKMNFEQMHLPRLRYVTQAGGRLAPQRVRGYAELGRRQGWEFFVMYGATEATARMAYLPPRAAAEHPASIGRPIPGGSFTVEPVDEWSEPGVGELVYHGPNVMMGYAHSPADLSSGIEVGELRTGDIGRLGAGGYYEILGRRARFVKMYGLRVDLQRVQDVLTDRGITSLCTTTDDERLVVAVEGESTGLAAAVAAEVAGVPENAVTALTMPALPMVSAGKPDYGAVRTAATLMSRAGGDEAAVRDVFAKVLHVNRAAIRPDSTFLSLGGTSLNYVTASVLLEPLLTRLPPGWQQWPVARLETLARTRKTPRRWFAASLETSVALRAAAIVLIVGSHVGLFELWGGAHILLGIAGYNFARFCLTPVDRSERIRHLRMTIAWIAVPSIAWIALVLLLFDDYRWTNLLLANKILGPSDSLTAGRLWFIEVLVYTLIALTLIFAIPVIDRMERRYGFGMALAFLGFGMVLRYDLPGFDLGRQAWFTYLAFWFFAAGWAAGKARNSWQRLVVSAVLVIGIYGYFDSIQRDLIVLVGLLVLIWAPTLRAPEPLPLIAGVVAEASLFIYLTHFQIYPLFDEHPVVAVVIAIITGILIARLLFVVRRRWSTRTTTPAGVTAHSV